MTTLAQIQVRRGNSAQWNNTDPVLASGEWGLETDSRLVKIGDGVTAWNLLDYFADITDLSEDVADGVAAVAEAGENLDVSGVWQSYSPTVTAVDSFSSATCRFVQVGKIVTVRFDAVVAGDLNETLFTMTLPVPLNPPTITNQMVGVATVVQTDVGSSTVPFHVLLGTDGKVYLAYTFAGVDGSSNPLTYLKGYLNIGLTSYFGYQISGTYTYEAL